MDPAVDALSGDQDVVAAAQGDRAAFGRLYQLHAASVHAYLHRSGAGTRTDDLTAETFLRAFRAMPRYQDRGVQFRTWLFRIATNLMIETGRKKSSGEMPTDTIEVTSAQPGPEDQVIGAQDAQRMVRALGTLDARDRSVLTLRYIEGLAVTEVAAVLQLSEVNVRQLARRALARLRTSMGEA